MDDCYANRLLRELESELERQREEFCYELAAEAATVTWRLIYMAYLIGLARGKVEESPSE